MPQRAINGSSLDQEIDAFLVRRRTPPAASTAPAAGERTLDGVRRRASSAEVAAAGLNDGIDVEIDRFLSNQTATRHSSEVREPATGPSVNDLVARRTSQRVLEHAADKRDERTGFARAYDTATAPLVPQVARGARAAADAIDEPRDLKTASLDTGAFSDVARNLVREPVATLKGAAAGVIEGAGDVLSSMTSPLDLALTATTGGAALAARRGARGAARVLGAIEAAGGGATVARGAERVIEGDSASERLTGVAQIAGGAAGAKSGISRLRTERTPGVTSTTKALADEIETAPVVPVATLDDEIAEFLQRPSASRPRESASIVPRETVTPAPAAAPHVLAAEDSRTIPPSPKRRPVDLNPLDDFETFAKRLDEGIDWTSPVNEPGQAGHLIIRTKAEPLIAAADVRSPNPNIERRFEPPSRIQSVGARGRAALQGLRDAAGRAFQFEYDLTKAGLGDARERLDTFNRERLDAPKKVMDTVAGVLTGVRNPEEYHAFQRIVLLRRDLELADAMQQGRLAKRPLESGLTPLEARSELDRLMTVAERSPAVLRAAERHRALVRRTGNELVERGLMQADTRDRNADYFPGLVLDRVRTDPNLTGRPVAPLTPGKRGFLKQAKGGAAEKVRDYIDGMSRHLADVQQAIMRDDLVKDLARQYDTSAAIVDGGQPLSGYSAWTYGDGTYLIPNALRERLVKFTQKTPREVAAMNRVTDWWKGATLRVLGLPYEVLNFTGDLANFLVSEPVRELPKAPGRLIAATRASLPVTPRRTDTHTRQLQAIAALGERLNLGTGGATAELGRAVAQRPELREIARPLGETVLTRLARLPGDLYTRAAATQDRFREFRENIPRLAKFMAEMERGSEPETAARVTRRELVDYSRLTDFERTWLRGVLMPFYTFFKQNAVNWAPGLRAGADGSKAAGALEAAQRIGKVMLPAYMVATYNETFFPKVEHELSEYDRNRFHVLVPWKEGVAYVGFTGPANAAAGLVGLQGTTQRSLDLVRGRTTVNEELERSGRQIRRNVGGLVSPFVTEPVEQALNTDLLTERPIVPNRPGASVLDSFKARGRHAAEGFAPVSQVMRASEEAGSDETGTELLRRLVFGSLAKRVDEGRNEALARDRAVARGEHNAAGAREQQRGQLAGDLTDRFLAMGPEETNRTLEQDWDALTSEEEALVVRALREATNRNRKFLELQARWRTAQRSVSDVEAPYVRDELRRKNLIPVTPR